MPVHGPVEVFGGGFVDRGGGGGEAGGDVVLEAVLADVAEELLHVGDLDHAGAAEGVERVVGEGALADVAGEMPSILVRACRGRSMLILCRL